LSDDLSIEDILETQAFFRLPSPALVEKDFYVVRALRAIAATETAPLRFVFGGGTALGRAHRLLQRMSEDIDLKIVSDGPIERSALRASREALIASLLNAGFEFDPDSEGHLKSRNASRHMLFRLPYKALTRGEAALRPNIQIEAGVWPLRRPTLDLPVSSFVAEAFKRTPEVARMACVSVTQTAAEKLVALTRRTAAELADANGPRDAADIRHLYDLHIIRGSYDVAEVASLAQEIMPHDAKLFGHHFPAYRDDPMAETRRAIDALSTDKIYAERYAEFCRLMVFGEQPGYAEVLATVQALAGRFQG